MIEINYVPIYMKINHIFFVIKGQFPVTDYIPNTKILCFIVHCIYVLRIFYCITCLCLSLTPPVSGLRCIVFNKVLFCSVLFCSITLFAKMKFSRKFLNLIEIASQTMMLGKLPNTTPRPSPTCSPGKPLPL